MMGLIATTPPAQSPFLPGTLFLIRPGLGRSEAREVLSHISRRWLWAAVLKGPWEARPGCVAFERRQTLPSTEAHA